MTIKLHCFGESGHSYKAALGLQLAGLEWEPIFVDFFKGQSRDPDWRSQTNVMLQQHRQRSQKKLDNR